MWLDDPLAVSEAHYGVVGREVYNTYIIHYKFVNILGWVPIFHTKVVGDVLSAFSLTFCKEQIYGSLC